MRVGPGEALLHATQQRTEGWIAREIAAQDQRVDKEANQALRLRLSAIGGVDAEQEVFLAGIAIEQSLEGGEQQREEAHAFPPAQRFQIIRQLAGQPEKQCCAV